MNRKIVKIRKEADTQERIRQLESLLEVLKLKAKLVSEELDNIKFRNMMLDRYDPKK